MAEPKKVELPGVGEVKRSTAIIGGGVIVAIVGYVYIRNKRAKAAAAGSTTGTVTDPAGNVCAALNPQSGYCPGSPEDQQYLQQQSAGTGGFGPGYGQGGVGFGSFVTDAQGNTCTAIDPLTGLCPVAGAIPGRTSVTTNAEWVQEAELQLGQTSQVQAALGYALSGQPVTQDQKNLFMEAVGLLGAPPQGYPPLNVVGGTHHPPPKSQVTVPYLIGERVENASSSLQALGLKAGIPNRKPGIAYEVTKTSPARGTRVVTGSTVHLSIKPVSPGTNGSRPGQPVPVEIPGGPERRP